MFNFLKRRPEDVKGVRSSILQLIKDTLKKNEGGEGGNIKSIRLYLSPSEKEQHIYRAAVFADEADKFKKEEIQRIADDFDLALPEQWKFETFFQEHFPKSAITSNEIDAAVELITTNSVIEKKDVQAYIRVLNGETEQQEYEIHSNQIKFNIGREKQAQTAGGFFRKNFIAFVNKDNPANWSVSRQHAHIEWNEEQQCFYLFADEGGIPPNNKIKVRGEDGIVEKIQTIELGHKLREPDQIILGESAVLEFSFMANSNK